MSDFSNNIFNNRELYISLNEYRERKFAKSNKKIAIFDQDSFTIPAYDYSLSQNPCYKFIKTYNHIIDHRSNFSRFTPHCYINLKADFETINKRIRKRSIEERETPKYFQRETTIELFRNFYSRLLENIPSNRKITVDTTYLKKDEVFEIVYKFIKRSLPLPHNPRIPEINLSDLAS